MIFSSRLKEMLETFRVCDLKSLLDKYNLSHSGTKAALFNRLISFLCKLRTVEEQTEFIQRVDDLYFTRERSLKTRGRARAVARPKSYLELFYPHENYEVSFSLSPFHRFIRSIHQFASDDHSTLHIVKEFSFSQLDRLLLYAQARTARADSRHLPFLKVLLLTAPVHRDNTCPLRIQYPNCFIIEVNEHVIQRTCKKKGAMDVPLDISGYVRLDHVNLLRIHLLTRERLHVQICLAEYSSPSKLLHKLYSEKFIPANVLFSEWSAHLSRANDEELQVESSGLSLLSPLTLSRITTPCRSLGCRHLQCFDALDYLSLNEKCPSWTCPLCNQPADFDSLVVDGYFLSLLVGAPPDVKEMVITYTDGLNWEIAYKDNRKRPRGIAKLGVMD
jgi:hypothetical protein